MATHPAFVAISRQSWRSNLLIAQSNQLVWVRSSVKDASEKADVFGVFDIVEDGAVFVAVGGGGGVVVVEELHFDVESDALDFRASHHDIIRVERSVRIHINKNKNQRIVSDLRIWWR